MAVISKSRLDFFRWLIVVEGVEATPGAHTWWGGNLATAGEFPVALSRPLQLVYSVHDYPASVYRQSWFDDAAYPENLHEVWQKHWAYLVDDGGVPVLLGEFGTFAETEEDKAWLKTILAFTEAKKLSFAFWCLNPNSADTGGILLDDWKTPHALKMATLRPYFVAARSSTDAAVPFLRQEGRIVLGSKGKQKIEALEAALAALTYSGKTSERGRSSGGALNWLFSLPVDQRARAVCPVAVSSLINEQPWGFEETLQGALNRLAAAKSVDPGGLLFVAVENGLVDVAGETYDFAWVVAEDSKSGTIARAMSTTVRFPDELCDAVRTPEAAKVTTVGSLIAAATAGCDPQDPHTLLTSHAVSRKEILQQAILVCLGQLATLAS